MSASFCDPGEQVTWNLGTLAAGQSATLSMPMVVTNGIAAGALITLPAEVSVNGVQAVTASKSVTVDGDNALTLALHQNHDTATPAEPLTYTLTYGNRATTSVAGTGLTLPLPAGVTFVSASGGGILVGNSVQWMLNTLQAGASARQQVVVLIDGGLVSGAVLPIEAEIAGTSAATGAELARATALTRVHVARTLSLAVEMNPDPARQNEGLRAELTVTNHSASPLFGTVLQARMPTDGVDRISPTLFTGSAACPPSFCDPYELVTWNLGTLAPGASVTVSMPLVVTNSTSSGRLITLEAMATADGANNSALAAHTVAVDNDNAISLNLDEDKDSVAPGEGLTYTLTYGNRSDASVASATLKLPLPSGVSFVAASGGGVLVGDTVQWTLNHLQAGESGRQQVKAKVDTDVPSGRVMAVDAAELAGTGATTGAEFARAASTTRVNAAPALGLVIEMNADPARPNEGLRAELTVTNRSGATLFGTVLQARMPTDGVDRISPTLFTGSAACPPSFCDPYELVTWSIGTLAPGAAVTVAMPLVVTNGTASGRLIALDAVVTADAVPAALVTHSVAVDGDNVLTLGLDEDKDTVAPGDRLTYTLTYGNRSGSSVTATTLRFPIPVGTTLVGASGATLSADAAVWNLGTLLAGTGGRKTVTVQVDASSPPPLGVVVDAAMLAGNGTATGPELARATATTRIAADNPLRLSVRVAPKPVEPNQTLTATLRVTNTGALDLNGTVVRARMPTDGVNRVAPAAFTAGASCPPSFCDPYELVTWNLGTLAAGATTTLTMPLVVINGTQFGQLITLDAEATEDGGLQATATDTALVGIGSTVDSDGDGSADELDNCTNVVNPSQRDSDGDDYGNECDGDFDNSGFVNFADLALMKARFNTTDADADLNGDGLVNFADLAIFKTLFNKAPGPSGLRP